MYGTNEERQRAIKAKAANLEGSTEEIEIALNSLETLRTQARAILATLPEFTKSTYNLRSFI